eukprot:CAMPEP_0117422232 /NCGR_PEP_ID=MMETSP0758-20121206/3115_1 /TAXON_ID=63605 /ORGANISM="Percolomonas cosmopolitus, Strain AE-1 (ATCC 50343)" /LENGTH=314 /DNA_ID=CAMNT_0005204733 /DNA_START=326 /DNA_END=1266 /DNA_ORIENTATION=-
MKSLVIFLGLFNDNSQNGVKKALLLTHSDKYDKKGLVKKLIEQMKTNPALMYILSDDPLKYILNDQERQSGKFDKEIETIRQILRPDEIQDALLDHNIDDEEEEEEEENVIEESLEIYEEIKNENGTQEIQQDEALNRKAKELEHTTFLDVIPFGAVALDDCYCTQSYEINIQKNEERKQILLDYIEAAEYETKMENFPIVNETAMELNGKLEKATEYLEESLRLLDSGKGEDIEKAANLRLEYREKMNLLYEDRGLMVLDSVQEKKRKFYAAIEGFLKYDRECQEKKRKFYAAIEGFLKYDRECQEKKRKFYA